MIRTNLTPAVSLTKNLISDQTYDNLSKKLNTTNVAFDATNGLGRAAAESSAVLIHTGGFDDQRITAVMNWPSPTTAGNEDIGVMLRCLTMETNANYYYFRVVAGFARISKVINGSFTTLTQSAWASTQATNITIVASAVGSLLTATFSIAGGSPADVTLSTTDTAIPHGGIMGFRSLTSAVWCRSILCEQIV